MAIYLPTKNRVFTETDAQKWLANILVERELIDFTAVEKRALERAMYGKLMNERTQAFFFYHMAPLLAQAVNSAFAHSRDPVVLELGCGSGTASLLFALLGARVVGIDLDPNLVRTCEKRRTFYAGLYDKLDVSFYVANAFDFAYEAIAPIDFVYSLFAFNLMQPSGQLISLIVPNMHEGGRMFISDGNKESLFNSVFRKRKVLAPLEMEKVLISHGFITRSLTYDCMIPPLFVRHEKLFALASMLEDSIRTLPVSRWLALSYSLDAEK